jgi:hypothetical protein
MLCILLADNFVVFHMTRSEATLAEAKYSPRTQPQLRLYSIRDLQKVYIKGLHTDR